MQTIFHPKFSPLTRLSQDDRMPTLCKPPTETFISPFDQRRWLKTHGKSACINFSDEALQQLRKYFDSLDEKGKGSLGLEELEDPFIAFGLSENRQEVEELIKCKNGLRQLWTSTVREKSSLMSF